MVKWNINTSTMIMWPILFESTSLGVRWIWIQILTVYMNVHNIVSLCLSLLICDSCCAGHLLCAPSEVTRPFPTLFCAPRGINKHSCPLVSTWGAPRGQFTTWLLEGHTVVQTSSNTALMSEHKNLPVEEVCVYSLQLNRAPDPTVM